MTGSKAAMIKGLSHITFVVRNLEKMTTLLEEIFGAKEVYASGEKSFSLAKEKFFLLNDLWIAVMEGEPLAEKTYNHVAFQIDEASLDDYAARVKALGLEMREDRPRIAGEGRSLYFYDFDNHLFELHAGKLGQRLEAYAAQSG